MKVKRTERGWAGHFFCADRCLFRRNTLLEYGEVRIVVSTIGLMLDDRNNKERKFVQIGFDRYFETMAFHAHLEADRYREISFDSPWAIGEVDADDKANDMHEAVVDEITKRLKEGTVLIARFM